MKSIPLRPQLLELTILLRHTELSGLDPIQLQQTPGDDQTLDFAGALADGEEFGIAIIPLDGKVLGVAIAAMNLDAL